MNEQHKAFIFTFVVIIDFLLESMEMWIFLINFVSLFDQGQYRQALALILKKRTVDE